MEQIFCECGEYLGVKNLETNEIEIDSEVEYSLSIGYPNILHCPYCEKVNQVEGSVIEI
ncbi:hypothetical protein [Clostridium gasigenes]|uniref:Uncharacterized protein n=1 Tax=Clostridium gasigenes TaxID=94869 RepID=A0A7X0VSV7_9CLOT|nr:hypothetical protein [Clostridium gasigenes]MBB6716343.1 hypothetical protein [Clostridium gasigenes]